MSEHGDNAETALVLGSIKDALPEAPHPPSTPFRFTSPSEPSLSPPGEDTKPSIFSFSPNVFKDVSIIENREIDPDGDTYIALKNPNARFAIWDVTSEPVEKLGRYREPQSLVMVSQRRKTPVLFPGTLATSTAADQSRSLIVKFRVSSRHLTYHSKFFNAMFNGPWKEANSDDKEKTVDATDWDVGVFTCFLKILHGYTRDLKGPMGYENLAKLVVLADYYDCVNSINVFLELWAHEYSVVAGPYSRAGALGLTVLSSCVHKGAAADLAKMCIIESRGPIQTMDLPIPHELVEWIDKTRVELISSIFSQIFTELEAISKALGPYAGCQPDCRYVRVGALTSALIKFGLLAPEEPYLGVSIAHLTLFLSEEIPEPKSQKKLPCARGNKCDIAPRMLALAADTERKAKLFPELAYQILEDKSP